ncbi:hypothetical protein [Conchiformibius kuhniae]|uniref:Uncharacterized protein n=1 Tax=Conchiformibius kuhniae TaxID=211502 RepID=A0A8T9MWH5_9NEIS|nr:hypothetical protein [Conchiformibius kuhniae]UOP04542.1 hypothetical protein LVJ77_09770 [Conchiformibius kuhniae]
MQNKTFKIFELLFQTVLPLVGHHLFAHIAVFVPPILPILGLILIFLKKQIFKQPNFTFCLQNATLKLYLIVNDFYLSWQQDAAPPLPAGFYPK